MKLTPWLFLSRSSLQQLQSTLPQDPAEVRRWTSQQPDRQVQHRCPAACLVCYPGSSAGSSPDQSLRRMAAHLLIIETLLKQNGMPAPGVAPHPESTAAAGTESGRRSPVRTRPDTGSPQKNPRTAGILRLRRQPR
ncbi:MAG UNVERIFIED_CONTAM: hypothetical protein LVR18_48485 [Planctomycetaceae bacterium]